ncbi:uncharacterized protein [Canis lupus baileyi]|uniref:uncharacterized protein isoform X3 n=1 Tax=Canis lupus baileyi TaxID=143281 RepID=UPI003B977E0A
MASRSRSGPRNTWPREDEGCKELTDIIGPVLGDKLQLEEGKRTEVFAEQLRQCHILIKDHAKELTGCIKSYGEGQIFLNASMSTSRTASPTMTLSILEGRVSKSSCLREAGWPSALPESSVQKIMTMRRMKKNKKHSPPAWSSRKLKRRGSSRTHRMNVF